MRLSQKEGASLTEQALHAVCDEFSKEIERCDVEVQSGADEASRFGYARLVRRPVSHALEHCEHAVYRAKRICRPRWSISMRKWPSRTKAPGRPMARSAQPNLSLEILDGALSSRNETAPGLSHYSGRMPDFSPVYVIIS